MADSLAGRSRWVARTVVAVALIIGVVGTGASPAAADEGVTLESTTVYRVEDGPIVTVEATYAMTNVKPDRQLGGGRFEYYFFTSLVAPIPAEASGLTATVNGREADVERISDQGFEYAEVRLGYELRYQRTADVVVTYTLAGAPARDEDSYVRINPAYVSFPAFVWADDGLGDMRIELPSDWDVDYIGDQLSKRVEDGMQIYSADEIPDPFEFWVVFTGRRDGELTSTPVTVGDADFEIRAWPGDDVWNAFAVEHVEQAVPVLEDIIGADWPDPDETDIIEASTPYLRGYAGFYFEAGSLIEVGEDLDTRTIVHELAHAWFNSSTIVDRWLSEGLAEAVSDLATDGLGDIVVDLGQGFDDVEQEPVRLNAWGRPFGADDPTEAYGYQTSYEIVRDLFAEIGEERRTDLLAAVIDGRRAYEGEVPIVDVGPIGWREFLDLAEQLGGSSEIEAVYRDLVVTSSQLDELERRADQLAAYDRLVDLGDGWIAPEAVRSQLAAWRFGRAGEAIDATEAALDVRDELVAALSEIGLNPTEAVELEYETTEQLETVTDALTDQRDAARDLVDHVDQLTAVLEPLSLDTPVVTQADYEADPIDVVDDVVDLIGDAEFLAETHEQLDVLTESIGLTPPPLDAAAFVDDRAAAQDRLEELVGAASAVDAAHTTRDGTDSFIERIGAIGSDADRHLADADRAFVDGDVEATGAAAVRAIDAYDQQRGDGMLRVSIAGGVLVLLLGVMLIVLMRRRRRRDDGDEASNGESVDTDAPVDDGSPEPDDAHPFASASGGD